MLIEPSVDQRVGELLVDAGERQAEAQPRLRGQLPIAEMQRADDERSARDDRLEFLDRFERDALFGQDLLDVEELGERAAEIFPHRQGDAAALGLVVSGSASARLSSARFCRAKPRRDRRHVKPETRRRPVERQSGEDRRHATKAAYSIR